MHMSEVHFSVLPSPGRKDIMSLSILVIIQKASICCNHEGSQFVCAEITAGALPSCCKCVCVLTQTGVFPSLQRTQHYINIHFLRTINPVCAWHLLFLSVTTFCACKGELSLFKLMFTQHERNTQRNRSIETELKLDSLTLHAGVVLHYCKMTRVTIHNL